MNKIDDNELITMGMNLGVFTILGLFLEAKPNQKALEILRQHCANELQKQTGIPAEDVALHVQPVIDEMMEKIK